MKLELDTDILRSSVQIASNANNMISDATTSLNRVVVHDDWNCPYRNNLKTMTLDNRAKIQQMQADADSFYNAIKTSSEKFDQTENTCISRSNALDSLLNAVHNIVPINGVTIPNSGPSVANYTVIAASLGGKK